MSTSNPLQPEPNPYAPPASAAEIPLAWTSEAVVESLRQTRPWVLFLSIVGFLVAGLIIVLGLAQAALSVGQPSAQKAGEAVGGGMFTLLMGVLYFFPSLYLMRFAGHIRALTHSQRVADLEAALSAQKSFWRFCGIVAALLLSLYAVILAGVAIIGVISALQN